jgi:hypothetical protein
MTRNSPHLYHRGAARVADTLRSDADAPGELGRRARSAMTRATRARRHHRRAAIVVPASLAAAGLLASGCAAAATSSGATGSGATSSGAAGSGTSSGATGSGATGSGATGSGAQAAAHGDSAGPAPPAGSAPCQASALKLSTGTGSGAAGSTYYPLDFTNVSRSACTLDGYPGASFVTGPGGTEIGSPAFRDSAVTSRPVTLPPGGTAHAVLQVQLAQNYPAAICKPASAHWLQVFAPGSTVALNLRFSAVTCTGKVPSGGTIGIGAVQPGATVR